MTVFTLIDALGWTYLKDRPFLPDVLTFRREVRTVLGFSSGAIPTILSGKLPRESGHWNLFYYDPEHSPFKWILHWKFLPAWALNTRIVRRCIRLVAQRTGKFSGYFQIYGIPVELLPFFDICEKQDIYKPGGVPSSIFDHLEQLGLPYRSYSYHQLSDAEIVRSAQDDLRAHRFNFYFLYLAELDAFLHEQCHKKDQVDRIIRQYEDWIIGLYESARQSCREVNFFVFSDHGMTPKRRGYNLIRDVRNLPFQIPRDYLALYDSTMARFWFFSSQARERITSLLDHHPCGRILGATEQRELGVDFSDRRFGELIFLMHPGILIEPSYFGERAPQGMHGFHPDDPFSSAIFLGNRDPGRQVRTLQDVHDVLLDWAETTRNATHVGS